jgi:hypothetical protein
VSQASSSSSIQRQMTSTAYACWSASG